MLIVNGVAFESGTESVVPRLVLDELAHADVAREVLWSLSRNDSSELVFKFRLVPLARRGR
jgi:hypothetical protein